MEDADLVILNTCHIREKAAEKVYSELGRVRLARERRRAAGGEMTIAVAGCVAQAEGEEILRRAPAVDLVFGPQSYHRLPDLLDRAPRDRRTSGRHDRHRFRDRGQVRRPAGAGAPRTRSRGPAAFVTVQEGCDKFCTFCVVPYTRGAELSRPVERIVAEVERLVAAGVREVSLLGQNVNAYHGEGPDGRPRSLRGPARAPGADRGARSPALHDLASGRHGRRPRRGSCRDPCADALAASAGSVRLRSHPCRHEPAPRRRRLPRDDRTASARRGRTSPSRPISSSASRARTRRISRRRLRLVEAVGFASAYSFNYSPRPGTPGADAPGPGRGRRQERAPVAPPGRARSPAARLQPGQHRPHHARPVRAPGQPAGPARRAARPTSSRCRSRRRLR